MKFIRLFILFVIFSSIIGIGGAFSKDLSQVSTESVEQKSLNVEKNDDVNDEKNVEENDEVNDDKNDDKKVAEENIKTTKSNETSKNINNSSDTKTSTNKETANNKSETTESITATKSIWEELGMSEDQYYNQPMYSWEHIDFSVSTYGSESKTKEACLKYGDSYEPYLNGEVSFSCSTVTSASGKYLGEMFYTEKLN